ncbi:MAG: hypothetical protein HC912_13170 [Saprospiraceae bacterium]|nr:hypothetical protein [Saprospiraceae bacterium]
MRVSWFYWAISFNSPIVEDLNCEDATPTQRLIKLGKLVGIAPHSRTQDMLQLAPRLAAFLRFIEVGALDSITNITAFLRNSNSEEQVKYIINLWQRTTGENIKQMPNAPMVTRKVSQQNGKALAIN